LLALPVGQPGTIRRVLRGGSWNNNQDNARAAYRNNNHPNNRNNNSHFGKNAVIPAGMQESSHRDVKPQVYDRLAVARSLPSLDAGFRHP
jgi:hypothetical protein